MYLSWMQVYLEVPNSEKIAQAIHSKVHNWEFLIKTMECYFDVLFIILL